MKTSRLLAVLLAAVACVCCSVAAVADEPTPTISLGMHGIPHGSLTPFHADPEFQGFGAVHHFVVRFEESKDLQNFLASNTLKLTPIGGETTSVILVATGAQMAELLKEDFKISEAALLPPHTKISPSLSPHYRLPKAPVLNPTTSKCSGNGRETPVKNSLLVARVHNPDEVVASLQGSPVFSSLKKLSSTKVGFYVAPTDVALATKVISTHNLVSHVERHIQAEKHNNFARGLIQSQSSTSRPLTDAGYTGGSQIVHVGDSGLDFYSCLFHDSVTPAPPIVKDPTSVPKSDHRIVHQYWAFMDALTYPNGHGTHVSGSVLGRVENPRVHPQINTYHGAAPGAKVVFTDLGCATEGGCACNGESCACEGDLCPEGEQSIFTPADLNEGLLAHAYAAGARISTHSWGSTGNLYSTESEEVDTFIHENEDMVVLFSAGNSGGEGMGTIGSPGTSKNAITVGAAQNMYESFSNWVTDPSNFDRNAEAVSEQLVSLYCGTCTQGCDNYTEYCDFAKALATNSTMCCDELGGTLGVEAHCCQDTFEAEVLYSQNARTTYNPRNLADFSSRGPTLDGRIKPDIVSPGEYIFSARSHGTDPTKACEADSTFEDMVLPMRGTSMSTPLTAGSAAIVREYLQTSTDIVVQTSPSAALVKAVLVNSAVQMSGLVHMGFGNPYNLAFLASNPRAPSFLYGHGALNLESTLPGLTSHSPHSLFIKDVRNRDGMRTDDTVSVTFTFLESTSRSFVATLVWTDPAPHGVSSMTLVNNLDLSVTHQGFTELGNAPGSGLPDSVNNVEKVTIPGPHSPGESFTVVVRAQSVTHGPQGYALVVSGDAVVSK